MLYGAKFCFSRTEVKVPSGYLRVGDLIKLKVYWTESYHADFRHEKMEFLKYFQALGWRLHYHPELKYLSEFTRVIFPTPETARIKNLGSKRPSSIFMWRLKIFWLIFLIWNVLSSESYQKTLIFSNKDFIFNETQIKDNARLLFFAGINSMRTFLLLKLKHAPFREVGGTSEGRPVSITSA